MREILQAIRSFLRSTVASIRYVAKPVYAAGKWTTQLVLEHVVEPVVSVADNIISLPGRLLGGGGGVGPKAADAAGAAGQQVEQTQAQADRVAKIQRAATILQRAAAARLRDDPDWEAKASSTLKPALVHYLRHLTAEELRTLADADPREVAAYLAGEKNAVEGVRSSTEVDRDVVRQLASARATPSPVGTVSSPPSRPRFRDRPVDEEDAAMLNRLGERMRRMQARDAENEEGYEIPAPRFA